MNINDFDFFLPDDLIAKFPLKNKEEAKMLVVPNGQIDGVEQDLLDKKVSDFIDFLNPNDVIVFNDTKVIPVRLYYKKQSGAKIEITLYKQIDSCSWIAFCKNTKRLNEGDVLHFSDDFYAVVVEKQGQDGTVLKFNLSDVDLLNALEKYGTVPLPPYIKREITDEDKVNYQTVFAKNVGAVASPTAGLHFTNEMLDKIRAKGVSIVFLTLHVGAGTFLPIKTDNVLEHKMHSEYGIVSKETADLVNKVKSNGGRVFAVGTTAMRLLETAGSDGVLKPYSDYTDIFITPGYKFQMVDVLMTNFHIPKSTLFILVCAFAGTDMMKKAYQHAIDNKYSFYSYGDSSLLYLKKIV